MRARVWEWLAALSRHPKPIFVRELRVRLRGRQGSLLLLFYVGVLGGIALLVLGIALSSNRYGTGPTQRQLSEAARMAVLAGWVTQIVLLSVALPGMLGGSVALERSRQTFEQLITTPLRPLDILLGKYCAAVVQAIYLIVASVPVIVVCFALGGVSWQDVLPSLAVCMSSCLFVGALSICASTYSRSPVGGIVAAYAVTLIYMLGMPILDLVLTEVIPRSSSHDPYTWPFVPWAAVAMLYEPVPQGSMSTFWIPESYWWISSTVASLALMVLLLTVAHTRIARLCQPGSIARPLWSPGRVDIDAYDRSEPSL